MSGVLRFEATLAVGGTVVNLLAGSILERLTNRPETVSVYGVMDVIAGNTGLVTFDLRLGNVVVADRVPVPGYTLTHGPDRDKHLIARAAGLPFDLVQLRLFNGGAAGAPYRFLVEQVPM